MGKIEMTPLQLEMRAEIQEVIAQKDVDVLALIDTMFSYITHGASRTVRMKDLLSVLRSGKLEKAGDRGKVEVLGKVPALQQPQPPVPSKPARVSVPRPVPPIEETRLETGTRFTMPVKKTEFNFMADVPAIQQLIARKVFVEGVQSPDEVNVNQLTSRSDVLAFLRKQVDFVFTTIKSARENIAGKYISMVCPNCQKQMDHWEKKGEKEAIVFVFDGAKAAKSGVAPLLAYHKSCLIMDFHNFRGGDAEDE